MLYAALGGFSALPTYCCSQELKSQGWRSLFPLSIGIALIEGVIPSYLVQSKGNPYLLGAGVVLALLAAVLISKAYGSLSGVRSGTSRKGFIICIVSGVLMGAFAPFNAHALIAAHPLTPL
jgi:glucose uptake protein